VPYSVHLMFPAGLEARLRQWCAQAPGASWPRWGGHITLVPEFKLTVPLLRLLGALERIAGNRRAFAVTLDTTRVERHLLRPDQFLVYLTGSNLGTNRELLSLRAAVVTALEGMKIDLSPAVSRHPFMPHLSLTLGLPGPEARQLQARAERDGLRVQFTVRRLTLLETTAGPEGQAVYCFRDFALKK